MLNIFLEYVSINFILHREVTHVLGLNIAPEVGSWIMAQSISFPAGFIMSRHIVFPESNLHGRVQLFRYALTTASFILLSYILIKFFAYAMPALNPTIAYTFVCIITAILSYISQRRFTFKITPEEVLAE